MTVGTLGIRTAKVLTLYRMYVASGGQQSYQERMMTSLFFHGGKKQ